MTEHERMLVTKYDLLFESRLTKVETTLDNMGKNINDNFREIKSDIRWLLGMMIMFSGIILGLMGKGFHWY